MQTSPSDSPLYKGMTASQLADAYDVYKTIPDAGAWLQRNREQAAAARASLQPITDLPYGPEPIQKLDIYALPGATGLPVLLDIHGGGWSQGSKGASAMMGEAMMSEGVLWVPIDYGLAPAYRLDEIIAHVRRALAWVYKNIARYGGDPDRIFVYGTSAGGHLAASTLMPQWCKDFGVPEHLVKGVVATSGIYDLDAYVYAKTGPQEALQMTLAESRQASPLHHPPRRPVPCIIAYGSQELRAYHEQSQAYAQMLQEAGCEVSLIEVTGANHFSMINELKDKDGQLFKSVMAMIS